MNVSLPREASFWVSSAFGARELELSGHFCYWLLVSLKLFELDISKPNGLAFGLEGDVTMG